MISRRNFLKVGGVLVAAPFVVSAERLMPTLVIARTMEEALCMGTVTSVERWVEHEYADLQTLADSYIHRVPGLQRAYKRIGLQTDSGICINFTAAYLNTTPGLPLSVGDRVSVEHLRRHEPLIEESHGHYST